MSLRALSIVAFLFMVAGIGWLAGRYEIVARAAPLQILQLAAVALMVWARVTFGRRSFHAAANPTEGGLVTTGPYRWVRHPIYAAVLYYTLALALDLRVWQAVAALALVATGAVLRARSEESLLTARYPHYAAYAARTARFVPFLL